ncbi:MAG: phage major capsid protein [Candidatus Binataceae bacterium]
MDQSEMARALKAYADAMEMMATQMKADREAHGMLRTQVIELAQKMTTGPHGGDFGGGSGGPGELADLIVKSDGLAQFAKGNTPRFEVEIPSRLLKTQILNAPGQNQPLVPADRPRPGIVFAPQQRLTIRALFTQIPTASNLIEVPTESAFTNNARPQGDISPVGSGEGELKAESAMTFSLSTVAVVTIAHHIPASRQILSDAPALQAHIEGRLVYGLALEEEQEMLTGVGAAGELNGINNQAASFTGGVTNQTRLDTLAKGANQLAVANYEPSGFILHPTDWLNCRLEKDTTGRYVLGDPAAAGMPTLWGLPVVATPSQTLGRFTVLDAMRAGYIADRELATVRISENVGDQFVRNLITILCESRVALVVEQANAMVYGNLATPG